VHIQLDAETAQYGAIGELPALPFHASSKKLESCGIGAPVLHLSSAQDTSQHGNNGHVRCLSSGDWNTLRAQQGDFSEACDASCDKPVAPPAFPTSFGTGSTSMSGWSQSIGSLSAHHLYTTTRSLSVEQLPASARRIEEDKPEELGGKARNGSVIGHLVLDRLAPLNEVPGAISEEVEMVTPVRDRESSYRRSMKSIASASSVASAGDVKLGTPQAWEVSTVSPHALNRVPRIPTLSQGNVVYHHRPRGGAAAGSHSSSDSLHESGVDMSGLSAMSPGGHASGRSNPSMGDSAASTNTHV
jgi:hypothetical protein